MLVDDPWVGEVEVRYDDGSGWWGSSAVEKVEGNDGCGNSGSNNELYISAFFLEYTGL